MRDDGRPRLGRPQQRGADGVDTREGLLAAARDACAEHGFDGTTMSDIAGRVGIKVPSIYNHFPSKTALLIAAVRQLFDARLAARTAPAADPAGAIAFLMAPELRQLRRLAIELHGAATRHPDVAEMLHAWHREAAGALTGLGDAPGGSARATAFLLLLIGLCHLDDFDHLGSDADDVRDALHVMGAALFGLSPGPGTDLP